MEYGEFLLLYGLKGVLDIMKVEFFMLHFNFCIRNGQQTQTLVSFACFSPHCIKTKLNLFSSKSVYQCQLGHHNAYYILR